MAFLIMYPTVSFASNSNLAAFQVAFHFVTITVFPACDLFSFRILLAASTSEAAKRFGPLAKGDDNLDSVEKRKAGQLFHVPLRQPGTSLTNPVREAVTFADIGGAYVDPTIVLPCPNVHITSSILEQLSMISCAEKGREILRIEGNRLPSKPSLIADIIQVG
ncbi:hypothetical protein EV363DRAFT_579311 [Boletus edulis]|nr:hypothetical protein EV363DRAFT_579311 [Boletus edulis]